MCVPLAGLAGTIKATTAEERCSEIAKNKALHRFSATHLLPAPVCRYRVELRGSGRLVDVPDCQLAPDAKEGSRVLVLPGKGEQMKVTELVAIDDSAW